MSGKKKVAKAPASDSRVYKYTLCAEGADGDKQIGKAHDTILDAKTAALRVFQNVTIGRQTSDKAGYFYPLTSKGRRVGAIWCRERAEVDEIESAEIARLFAAVLRERLKPDEIEEVVRRNAAERDPAVCHSHDFMDANEAMAEAFRRAGRTVPRSDKARGIWNRAWSEAAKARFFTDLPTAPRGETLLREDGTTTCCNAQTTYMDSGAGAQAECCKACFHRVTGSAPRGAGPTKHLEPDAAGYAVVVCYDDVAATGNLAQPCAPFAHDFYLTWGKANAAAKAQADTLARFKRKARVFVLKAQSVIEVRS